MSRTAIFAFLVFGFAATASAQPVEGLSFRPFVMVSGQQFTATETFKASFGDSLQMLWGGGLNVTQDDRYYLELSASRFKKTGERAFRNNGQNFGLGIPLTATITPFEMTAGYRFHRRPRRPTRFSARSPEPSRLIPFLGGGVGLYRYQEVSGFAQPGDDVDTQHAGAIAEGGVEIRLHRWIGVALDARYTYVPGILGLGGVSQVAGEKDLGGIAGRVKVVVGR